MLPRPLVALNQQLLNPFFAVLAVGALLGLQLIGSSAEASRQFYLSTDQIFSPGEQVSVKLEARGTAEVDVRVYRLDEAGEYLLSLPDPHRPMVQTGRRLPDGGDLLSEAFRRGTAGIYGRWQERLTENGRSLGRTGFPQTVASVEAKAKSQPVAPAIGVLRKYPLISRFKEILSRGSYWTYRDIQLPLTEPGAYLVEAVSGSQGAHTLVVISQLALLTRQGPDSMTVFAVDQATGRPEQDVNIEIYENRQKVRTGKTDSQGLARFEIESSSALVMARKGEHFSVYDPRYFPSGLNDNRVYLFTERPAYRPGHEVFFKGMMRQRTNDGYTVTEGTDVTVDLIDANGVKVDEFSVAVEAGRFDGRFQLSDDAPMGRYTLVAELNGERFSGEFKVKAYKRPEFLVQIKAEAKSYRAGSTVEGTINGNYYYGAPMSGASVQYEVYRTRFYVPWWVDADFSWYYSQSEARSSRRIKVRQGSGTLNAEGKLPFEFDAAEDGNDYTYVVEAWVTDETGRAIPGRQSFQVTRGEFRLEVSTESLVQAPNQASEAQVKVVDFNGKPVSNQAVELRLFSKVLTETGEVENREFAEQRASTDASGFATFTLKVAERGYYELAAVATDSGGSRIEASGTLFVSDGEGSLSYVPGTLEVVADRRVYRRGDEATFLIMTPFAEGNLLVSVEGADLFKTEVLSVKNYVASYTMKIEAAQTPNFFLGVGSVFDGKYLSVNRSLVVPPAEKFLSIDVTSDAEVYKPGDEGTFTLKVTDSTGKPVVAELSVGVVDEKIYAISREMAIPIEEFFYPQRRNNVRGGSSVGFRFYGFAADISGQQAALPRQWRSAYGAPKALGGKVRRNFVDTLDWQPTVKTDASGQAVVKVTFADNLTQWRLTARAITEDTKVGSTTHKVRVRKDVVVDIASPWVMRERDEAVVRISARNYSGKDQPLELSLTGQGVELEGTPKTVSVRSNETVTLDYKVKASQVGTATLVASAKGEVGDAYEIQVPVLPYGVEDVVRVAGDFVPSDEPQRQEVVLTLPEGVDTNRSQMEVRVSSGVSSALMSALPYLVDFPYGCAEQTISRFLPNLVVARAFKELGIENPELEAKIPGYIGAGLQRLMALQNQDGGWGWWEDRGSDPILSTHVMFGLVSAKKLGYTVDANTYQRGYQHLIGLSRKLALDANIRAYTLYVMALDGKAPKTMLDRIVREKSLTTYAQALVAMALQESGMKNRAIELAGQVTSKALYNPETDAAHWAAASTKRYRWELDPVETTAAVIQMMNALSMDAEQIHQGIRWLMSQRQGDRWKSTRDTAAVVYSLADYFARAPKEATETKFAADLNGSAMGGVALSVDDAFKADKILRSESGKLKVGDNSVALEKSAGSGLFYSASIRYWTDDLRSRDGAFRVNRSFRALKRGATSWQVGDELPVFDLGDLFLVELEVTALGESQDFVFVKDPLVGGFEVMENDAGYVLDNGTQLQIPGVTRVVLDDQVGFFLDSLNGTIKLAYLARAVRPGKYVALPTESEVMYKPDLRGHGLGLEVEVLP